MTTKKPRLLPRILLSIVLLLILAAAWLFFFTPLGSALTSGGGTERDPMEEAEALTRSSAYLDYDADSGALFLNRELVVVTGEDADRSAVDALADKRGAAVDDTLSELGIYLFRYDGAMDFDELQSEVKAVKKNEWVENAYLNKLTSMTSEEISGEAPEEARAAVFPAGGWNGDDWDTDVPRGENWGMEAVNAPGAWAYRDELQSVAIGLIDSPPDATHSDLDIAGSTEVLARESGESIRVSTNAERHGTHVSGIMGARWDQEGATGVLPAGGGTELYYSRVYHETDGRLLDFATAYDYVLAIKLLLDQDVRAINISQNTSRLIGFAASRGNREAIRHLTEQAEIAGLGLQRLIRDRQRDGRPDFVICVAAGNNNTLVYYADSSQPYGYRTTRTSAEAAANNPRPESGGAEARYNNFLNLIDLEEVRSRIIVVGAVGIDSAHSNGSETRLNYADFSNVGDRVDIVAPGVDVYSTLPGNTYGSLSGTSMATPHVTGAAGFLFGINPALSGPDVKNILLATATGRYAFSGGHAALLNVQQAVLRARQTRDLPVNRVIGDLLPYSGIDLCFVVDTTGSMSDDIENAQENMASILDHLAERSENYRVALVDYRDYPERTHDDRDYPARVQLGFTGDREAIIAAINALDLGYGGDNEETVYSGIMAAVGLDWRPNARKVIIILGDAAPLDPEPNTEYTYVSVLTAVFNADISIDMDSTDPRVLDDPENSLINIYAIGTEASSAAESLFRELSEDTGGDYADVSDASEVSDAVIGSIQQIEVTAITVKADFGADFAGQNVQLYSEDGDYWFTQPLDESGRAVLEAVEPGEYRWECEELGRYGELEIRESGRSADVSGDGALPYPEFRSYWAEHRTQLAALTFLICAVLAILPTVVCAIRRRRF